MQMSAFRAVFRNVPLRGAQGLMDIQKDCMKVIQDLASEESMSHSELHLAVNYGIQILANISSELCLRSQPRSTSEARSGATTDVNNPLQDDPSNTSTSSTAATEINLVADEITPSSASSASANIAPNSLGTGSNAEVSCATSQPQTTTTTTPAPPLPAAANTAAPTGPAALQPGSTASAIPRSPLRRERNAFLIPVTSSPGQVVGPIHVPPEGGFFDVPYVRDPPPSATPAAPIFAQAPVASTATTSTSGVAALPATSGDSNGGSFSGSPAPNAAASSNQLEAEGSMITSTSSQTTSSVSGVASPLGNRTPKRTRDSEDDDEEVARPSSRQRRESSPSPSSSGSNVSVRRSSRRHSSRE